MNPLVSFIIPAHNHARYLGVGIGSIFNQMMRTDFEVLVVDDGSTDETPEILQAYSDPRLSYIRQDQNRGTTATISHALTLTCGTYVAQLDADDRFRPDFLEATLPIFFAHPDLAMVYGDVAGMDEACKIFADPWQDHHARRLHGGNAFRGNELVLMLFHSPSSSTARLMRGDLARAQAPFPAYVDGRFPSTEWFLNLRLARHHDVYYIPRTLADYRIHSSNQHSLPLGGRQREQSIINILDHLFAEPLVQLQQRGLKPRAYGVAYLRLADSYFGAGNLSDARRCYLHALRWQPHMFLRAGGLHRLVGTGLGARRYAQAKTRVHGWLVRSG